MTGLPVEAGMYVAVVVAGIAVVALLGLADHGVEVIGRVEGRCPA